MTAKLEDARLKALYVVGLCARFRLCVFEFVAVYSCGDTIRLGGKRLISQHCNYGIFGKTIRKHCALALAIVAAR